jgi:hypothetical protein
LGREEKKTTIAECGVRKAFTKGMDGRGPQVGDSAENGFRKGVHHMAQVQKRKPFFKMVRWLNYSSFFSL